MTQNQLLSPGELSDVTDLPTDLLIFHVLRLSSGTNVCEVHSPGAAPNHKEDQITKGTPPARDIYRIAGQDSRRLEVNKGG